MTSAHFIDVFLHMECADAQVWSAVLDSEVAKSDDQVLKTLHHIHESQHAFLNAWLDRPFQRWKLEEFEGPSALAIWGKEFHISVRPFVEELNDDLMGAELVLPWAKYFSDALGHEPEPTTLRETLHQLPSHSMHHRGQVASRLRELGETPPLMDFIVWVWGGRPTPSWPVR